LQQAAQTVIAAKVRPAYKKLYAFFNETYLPACREDIGASSLLNGRAYYESRVRAFNTTDMTPENVHQIGLTEVARICGEMTAVLNDVEFKVFFTAFFEFYVKLAVLLHGSKGLAASLSSKGKTNRPNPCAIVYQTAAHAPWHSGDSRGGSTGHHDRLLHPACSRWQSPGILLSQLV
jgi:hypothetical protein